MNRLLNSVQIQVNENIYLKDPNSSALGKRIVQEGLLLVNEVGLEAMTFRKLSKRLKTTESSIYRYFESKFRLLIYLTSWYWGWIEYQLVFSTNNVQNPITKLNTCIEVIARNVDNDDDNRPMDVEILNSVVVSESAKSYLTKAVDEANKVGFYAGYKGIVQRMSEIMLEINPTFSYPHTLSSTIIEGIHHQQYFAKHLPSLTEKIEHDSQLADFFSALALSTLQSNHLREDA